MREVLMCTVATGIGAFGCYLFMRHTSEKSKLATHNETAAVAAALTAQGSKWSTQLVKPPLPTEVKCVLDACSLCYLSTTGASGLDPHLSLMNFTYIGEEELLVMTTRKDTLKLQNILDSPSVALLVHDFPTLRKDKREDETRESVDEPPASPEPSSSTGSYSITLYGHAQVAQEKDSERYRQRHLAHNPKSAQFIVGDTIAVVVIQVDSARICNNNDKVKHWSTTSAEHSPTGEQAPLIAI